MILKTRRRLRSWTRKAAFVFVLAFLIDVHLIFFSHAPAERVTTAAYKKTAKTNTKIFIASIHRNNEPILRKHWNGAVVQLAQYFGPGNVFLSVFESGSQDDTKGALRDLDAELQKLGVRTSIVLDKTVNEQVAEVSGQPGKEGWIMTKNGKKELRRIPYLAKMRNKVIDKLDEEARKGNKYDVVLWLNDVVFTTEDIVTLLATRNGDYDAVCSLDFSQKQRIYYDTFALRDSDGAKAVPLTWPYFQSSASRNALMANQPVPVRSCWNGIVAFDSEPFYADPPLRFRGVSDDLARYHLEGSECCFIHADAEAKRKSSKGVWLNPNVRVGYNATAYEQVNSEDWSWPSGNEKFWGLWANRRSRWFGSLLRMMERSTVQKRMQQWESEKEGNHETGVHCLINEMQVLYQSGWKHV